MSLSAFCFDVLAAEDLAFPLPDADLVDLGIVRAEEEDEVPRRVL